jgi:hypothetical protein
MYGHLIATLMARESTRRTLGQPPARARRRRVASP